uniref:Thioredoxin domain-containing protein n=1 Tax=Picea sitchensis TaxID=3332 RepID=A9NUT7_PICSI|nr:unknown [Picea sitchensis]
MAILGILLLQFSLMGMAVAGPLGFCPIPNLQDTFSNKCMAFDSDSPSHGAAGFLPDRVRELDAVSLEAAFDILQRSSNTYIAVLFYASWCPFSKQCRPVFNVLSSMFPTIHHVAVEESASKPRYGVHSFPALFLQNQTSRVRYHGSRKLDSILHFYENITGIKSISPDFATQASGSSLRGLDRVKDVENGVHCPYSWAKSPEKLLQQDTYLILAILFLVLRMLHFLFPKVLIWLKRVWKRHVWPVNGAILRENHPTFIEQILYIFNVNRIKTSLKLCKGRNFQEGAMNARAWASKSLASVSLGEGSSSKVASISEAH